MALPPDGATDPPAPDPLRRWVEQADDLRLHRSLGDAAREYRAILATYPADRSARRGLITTLVLQGDFAAALPVVDQLLRDDANDLETWRDRAAICRSLEDPRELLHSLRAIERLDPHDATVVLEEFRLLDVAASAEEAYRCLDRLLREPDPIAGAPSRAELFLKKGQLAEALGHSEDAQAAYGEAIATSEPDVVRQAATGGALLSLKNGRPDLALTILAAAIPAATSGSDPPADLLHLRGRILLQVERPEEAQEIYDALRAHDPSDPEALAGAARARIEQGKHPEAREILHDGLRRLPRTEALVLALAEAESGSGDLLAAERAVREGLEIVPQSRALWSRLAEIASVRSDWETAANGYRHAMELDPRGVECVLGAAFVAEQQGRMSEALSYYDRAATLAPQNVRVWTRRGIALAGLQRHAEAVESFDRALAIDPESDAAIEGKKLADRERRTRESEGHALAALRLEGQLGRPVTKNDLFVQLKVPFDQLDSVLSALSHEVKVDIPSLDPAAFALLEEQSCRLITAALERRPPGIETRGLTVADVAVLCAPTESLADVQRLFAYVDTVLRMDVRPENLRLSPQAEDVARRALALPPAQRTLFGLVRTLKIGIFQARVVKAVERASDSVHAPLPSVNLASHSPEFGGADEHADGAQFFSSENVPVASPGTSRTSRSTSGRHSRLWPLGVPILESQRAQARDRHTARCIACGGIASLTHGCGATLCTPCTRQFGRCPKCGATLVRARVVPPVAAPPTARGSPVVRSASARPAPTVAILPHEAGLTPSRPKSSERARPGAAPEPPRAIEGKARVPVDARRPDPKKEALADAAPLSRPTERSKEPTTARGGATPPVVPSATPPAAPRPRRDKPDDEPRL